MIKRYQQHPRVKRALLDYRTRSSLKFSDDALTQFMSEVGAYPLLTALDEQNYFARIESALNLLQEGGEVDEARLIDAVIAYEIVYHSNLRLVVGEAKKYQKFNIPLIDLIQEGCIGLAKAIRRFDINMGFKFSTYGTTWVKQQIARSVGDTSRTIRLPIHMHNKWVVMRVTYGKLSTKLGREPTSAEVAAEMNTRNKPEGDKSPAMTADRVETLVRNGQLWIPSLNQPTGAENNTELVELLEDQYGEDSKELRAIEIRDELEQIMKGSSLDLRYMYVLSFRFGVYFPNLANTQLDVGDNIIVDYSKIWADASTQDGLTLEEVSNHFGVTRERIRQIESKALKRLNKRAPASQSDED